MFGWFRKKQPTPMDRATEALSPLLEAAYAHLRQQEEPDTLLQIRRMHHMLWEAQATLEYIERTLQSQRATPAA